MRIIEAMGAQEKTTTKALGRLARIDARSVWFHEAHEFTPWLHENIDLLAEAIGVDIEATSTEVPIGDFAVDIVGRTVPEGHVVIIENQLAPTDHGHLGQLLTYAAGSQAALIVWVAPRFRDEHRQALDWLNTHTGEGIDFFGVELELLKIDDSLPAPHFKLVAQPNAWAKATREATAAQPSERALRYQRFFEAAITEFKKLRPGVTSASRVGPQNWFGMSAGRSGVALNWVFSGQSLRTELYIDTGDGVRNKAIFDALYAQREALEPELGPDVRWDRLDERRASRLAAYHPVPDAPPVDENGELVTWAMGTMARWNDALRPRLKNLESPAGPG